MKELNEIRELAEYLKNTRHQNRINAQEEEEQYYNDTFKIPWIKDNSYAVYYGLGAHLVNTPVEHLITPIPKIYRKPLKETNTATEAAIRVGVFLNASGRSLARNNPNPFKAFPHYLMRRGDAILYVVANMDYDLEDANSMPFNIVALDPLAVFVNDYAGETEGIPNEVIWQFERAGKDIAAIYPHWSKASSTTYKDAVNFLAYFDKDMMYFEVDKEPLLVDLKGNLINEDGRQENPFGIVPMVHAYSGFGLGTVDNDPAQLAVGRLRYVKGKIKELSAIASDLNFGIHTGAHRWIDIEYPATSKVPPANAYKEYTVGPNRINLLPIPEGGKVNRDTALPPTPQVFQHYYNVRAELSREDPPFMSGLPSGTSGRQEDIVRSGGLERFQCIVDNTNFAFSKAFGIALRICDTIPGQKPKDIKEEDISEVYDCEVHLEKEDPLENDRLSTMGNRMYAQGIIDLNTNLIKYQKYTQEDAQKIITKIMIDRAVFNNPAIAEIIGLVAADTFGMSEEYQIIKQRRQQLETQQSGLIQPPSETEMQRRTGETQTPVGMELLDSYMAGMGQRKGPTAYERA